MFALASSASAALLTHSYVSFAQGPTGDLGTYHETVGLVQVDVIGGHLYRWNDCFEDTAHCDRGFGIWGGGEWNEADPEINRGDFMRFKTDWFITAIWFSSVNDPGAVDIYGGPFPVDITATFTAADAGPDYIGRVAIAPTHTAWVSTRSQGFYFNALALEIEGPEPRTPDSSVPEPTSVLLLGAGLLAIARRRIRWE